MRMPKDQTGTLRHVGELLRDWRRLRRMTQIDLAYAADMSVRWLGSLESGKILPDRDAVLRLAERLEIPPRDRNTLLILAGYQPAFPVRDFDDPALADARAAIDRMLKDHEPNPALAIDRHWVVVARNEALRGLTLGVDPVLLCPPVNWVRLALHPAGLAPRIVNLQEWRAHIMARLHRQCAVSGDAVLADLLDELRDYPPPPASPDGAATAVPSHAAVPLGLVTVEGSLYFHGTATVFSSAVDVTLAELSIEAFFPADQATAAIMRRRAGLPAAAG